MISRRGEMGIVKREMNVVFGPNLKRGKVEYELREEGVRSLGPVEWREELWVEHPPEEEEDEEGRDERMELDEGRSDQGQSRAAENEKGDEEMAWSEEMEQSTATLERNQAIT
jgi:hypothetical protein